MTSPKTTEALAKTYTIDELAAHTGVPSRTIRFYQSSGALHKPGRSGRIALYTDEHVERLALIGQLQDRGLRMRAIRDLVQRIDAGEVALDQWLGLEGELQSSRTDDGARVLGRAELEELVGKRRPGLIADLVRHELIEAQTGGTYLVPSPGLLRLALELEEADIGLDVSVGATARLRKHLGKAAADLADHLIGELRDANDGSASQMDKMAEALRKLRPASQEWVRLLFAREMEQILRERLEAGTATPKRKRSRKR